MTYDSKAILITTKTNLHVGSGDINYDIVDKTVQRDSISTLPIINSSSMKGALRNHFDDIMPDKIEEGIRNFIFGNDDKEQGNVKFLDAYLLFLPLRSDKRAFYHVTSKENLLAFCNFYEELGYEVGALKTEIHALDDNTVFDTHNAYIEDILCKQSIKSISKLQEIFGKINIAIFSSENFIDACSHLPIIARNNLQPNKENLWYEEIVPRQSIFYTAQLDYSNFGGNSENNANYNLKNFYVELNKNHIQVGANASIGFGLCSFRSLSMELKEIGNAK
ncbi:MAG TPA: type III-B CRISPR module RAMP protein Cmr4 [Sulfurovum sp.]|nr:type III-B CRISPR module RAMP protein Cmr4 [Sulfurovum sp.]